MDNTVQAADLIERLTQKLAGTLRDLAFAEVALENANRTIESLESQLERYEQEEK